MIVGVAFYNIRTEELVTLPKPNRHNHIIHQIYEKTKKQPNRVDGWVQGFVDERGKFYDRNDAAIHVTEIHQALTQRSMEEYENLKLTCLFSEDLW